MESQTLLLSILLVPLASAALCGLFLRRSGWTAAFVSVGAAFAIMALSLHYLWYWDGEPLHLVYPWMQLGEWTLSLGFLFDNNTATMLLVVSVVAFFIHLFSMGYMDHDKDKGRFFAGLSIFMFSMLGIVLADNLFMLFIFWELVGFSSYALIAHYSATHYASMASKKAFIVNRVGDFGFLIGIIWTYWTFGTADLERIADAVGMNSGEITTGLGLLLMCGFLGKSAQFPLQVWLPDAMAGPTPVSALIHAATMVAAGIYMLVRINFLLTADVLNVILWLSAVMTAYAGFCALAQSDIKKILAYSTLSQLGYMGVAIGLGYPGLALFHLATHACFKALLFLGAGSVIHSLHHEQDIFKMGGLLKRMPLTSLTFIIGLVALCGVTYTSGYFSKDAIIEAAFFKSNAVFVLITLSAFMTSVYMGRLFWIAFLGEPKSASASKAHESPLVMTLPLLILAILSLTVGFVSLWPDTWNASFLADFESIHELVHESEQGTLLMIITTAAWILGLGLSYFFYKPGAKEDALEKMAPPVYRLSKSKFWFDEIYNYYVAKVQQRVAVLLDFFDLVFISGLFVRGIAGVVSIFGLLTRDAHTGSLHAYVYWFLFGLIIFSAFAFAGI